MSLAFGRVPRGAVRAAFNESGVSGEWILPTGNAPARTILYLHGGGYVACSPAQYRSLTGALALRCNARVLALDYPLAPEHPFPAAVDAALNCYRWLLASRTPASQIVVGGDSAGGGLSLSFLLAARENGLDLPAGAVLLSPWVDLTGTAESIRSNAPSDDVVVDDGSHSLARMYAGKEALDDPRISGVFADLRELPPMLIQASNIEMLRDDAVKLAENARSAGVDVALHLFDGVPHVWQLWNIPESREAFGEIARFVERVTT